MGPQTQKISGYKNLFSSTLSNVGKIAEFNVSLIINYHSLSISLFLKSSINGWDRETHFSGCYLLVAQKLGLTVIVIIRSALCEESGMQDEKVESAVAFSIWSAWLFFLLCVVKLLIASSAQILN